MNDFWKNWLEAVRFTCEAQNVISARLMLFASSSPEIAIEEVTNMVTEKFLAFAKAGMAAEMALEAGLSLSIAAERAYAPLAHCVHANSDRLTRSAA